MNEVSSQEDEGPDMRQAEEAERQRYEHEAPEWWSEWEWQALNEQQGESDE